MYSFCRNRGRLLVATLIWLLAGLVVGPAAGSGVTCGEDGIAMPAVATSVAAPVCAPCAAPSCPSALFACGGALPVDAATDIAPRRTLRAARRSEQRRHGLAPATPTPPPRTGRA